MNRWLKWTLRSLAGLAALVALILLFQVALLPSLVRSVLRSKLAEMGLSEADVEVRAISWWSAELANLDLDKDGSARVGSLAVKYSFASLLSGRIEAIEITGAQLTVRVRDGRLDLGALGRIKTEDSASTEMTELPFDRVDLRASSLLAEWEGRHVRVPCVGTILNPGKGPIELRLQVDVQGTPVRIAGTFLLSEKRLAFKMESGEFDIATLIAALPPGRIPLPLRAGGHASLNVRGEISQSGGRGTARFDVRDAWLRTKLRGLPVAVEGAQLTLELALAQDLWPQRLAGHIAVERVECADLAAEDIHLDMQRDEDALTFSGGAKGDGWRLKTLECAVQDAFRPDAAVRPAEAALELVGRLPAALAKRFRERGLDLSRLGTASLSARLTAKVPGRIRPTIPPFELTELRIALAPGDVVARNGDVALHGVSADLRLAGAGDAKGLRLDLLPQSKVLLDGVTARGGALQLTKAPPSAACLAVAFDKRGAQVRYPFGGDGRWTARLYPVTVTLGKATAQLASAARITGIEGALRIEAEAEPGRARAALLPGACLAFGAASGERFKVAGTRVELVTKAGVPPAECVITSSGPSARLGCTARLRPTEITVRGGQTIQLNAVAGEVTLAGKGTGTAAELTVGSGAVSCLGVATTRGIGLGRARFELLGLAGRPPARVVLGKNGLEALLDCELRPDGDLTVKAPAAELTVKGVRATAAAGLAGKLTRAAAALELAALDCKLPGMGYSAHLDKTTVTVDLKGAGTARPTLAARVAPGSLSVRDKSWALLYQLDTSVLTPVSGSFDLAERTGTLALKWPLQKDAILEADGSLNLAGPLPAGCTTVRLKNYRLDADDKVTELLTKLTGATVSGAVSLDAAFRLDRGRLVPRVTVTTTDIALSSKEYKAEVQGINGSVTLTGLLPPTTPGNQQFTIRRAEMGKLVVSDGMIAFRLEAEPPGIFVERTEWGWAGGRLYNHALRIDPKKPRVQVRLFADDLNLGGLLGVTLGEGSSGRGTLYGMLPVTFSPTNLTDIQFGRGFFYAKPGGGWWRLGGDTRTIAQDVLGQRIAATARTAQERSERERIIRGLLDFKYSLLKMELVRRDGDLVLRLTAQGHSLDANTKVEYKGVTIDFPKFESNLKKAILIKGGVGRAMETIENQANK